MTAKQARLFEDTTVPAENDSSDALIARFERFLARSWNAAEKLLEGPDPDGLFAVARGYYAIYNAMIVSAVILDVPLDRYRQGSRHHADENAIFHAQLPILASDLIMALEPPPVLGAKSKRATSAFELCRKMQKYRKRADYMGIEVVTLDESRMCIAEAKQLVQWVWGKTREHSSAPGTE